MEEPNKVENKQGTQVKFTGNKHLQTLPLPLPSVKTPYDFFIEAKNRNLLLSKDDNIKILEPPSQAQIKIWSQESKSAGGCEININNKDENYEVLQITNKAQFPGLQVYTVNTVGSRMVLSPPVPFGKKLVALPEYQFTLIDTTLNAEGLPPAVWIFRKLTGTTNQTKTIATESHKRMTSSFTRVHMDPAGEENKVILSADAHLEVRINIPSLMLRFLPVSLKTLEQQGSASIQKAVEKDFCPGFERFQNAYENWLFTCDM